MTEQTIGTARLDLVVNTENAEAGIARAKRSLEGFSGSAQQQYQTLSAAERRYVDSLTKQIDTVNLSKQGRLAYIATLKTEGAVQQELLARIKALEAAEDAAGKKLNQYGQTAKQTAAALRQVPAQVTDIVTGLATGQRPLSVLLQQGGQLKDLFGGVVPAARALGGALLSLINPLTVGAAAIAGIAYGFKQAEDKAFEFNKAVILTGRYSADSGDQLRDMAHSLTTIGGTAGSASLALLTVASSGKFTAEQLKAVAQASENMRIATGKSVADTAGEFERLAAEPSKAISELNRQYHFLSESTYAQIKALEDQGRAQDAATLAINTYASTVNDRADQIQQSLGFIGYEWELIKRKTADATQALLDYFRVPTRQERVSDLRERIDNFHALPREGKAQAAQRLAALQADLQTELNAQAVMEKLDNDNRNRQRINDLSISLQEEATAYESNEAKRAHLILAARNKADQVIASALKAGNQKLADETRSQLTQIVAGINSRFADKKGPRAAADPSDGLVSRIQQQITLNREELTSEQALTASERLRVAIQQQELDLGGKLTAARRKQIDALLDQLDASDKAAQAFKQQKKDAADLARLTAQLADVESSRAARNRSDLESFGLGRAEVDQLQRRISIEEDYARGVDQLRKKGLAADSDAYKAQEQALADSRDRMLATEQEFQDKLKELRGDWTKGARAAFKDFEDRAGDAAGAAYDLFSRGFDGAAQALTDFVTKGKGDFKGLLDSLAAELLKFQIEKQLVKLGKKLFPGLDSGDGDKAAALSKSAAELTASGGTLIAAAAALSGSAAALAAAGVASGGSGAGDTSGGSGIVTSLLNLFASAKGNVFSGGEPVHAYAYGGVVDRTTMFPMRRGWGVMGEAGPEAILPLRRGRDGRLGVQIADGGATGAPVYQTVNVLPGASRETAMQAADKSGRAVQRALLRSGR